MSEKRVQFSNIVQNQLPAYVRNDFPLISEFLKSYYTAQEFKSAPIDLIQNIDQYIKVQEQTTRVDSTTLNADITEYATTIPVQVIPTGTQGFPDSYGLIKIDDEIITYTGKTDSSFTGCIRGFAGISAYKKEADPENLVFSETKAATHEGNLFDSTTGERSRTGAKIENLSTLFLKEFLLKTKNLLLPGLQDRKLSTDLDQNIFIKQAKDFYTSKGTDRSFEILFKALYNEHVEIIRPRDFLFTPSNANYRITNDLVVEGYDGDPMDLEQATLYQDAYGTIEKAYGPVTNIEKIQVGIGETYYKLSLDAGYNRDARVDGATYGAFTVHSKTKVIGDVAIGQSFIDVDSTVGFAHSGNLDIVYSDDTSGIVSYTSKSVNQFYGVTNIVGVITDRSNAGIDTYAYGAAFGDASKTIKIKINSVLSKLNYPDDTYRYSRHDTARIKTLGIKDQKFKSRDWFYNVCPTYEVFSIVLLDASDWTYKVNLNILQYFRIGDSASIIGPDGVPLATTIVDITSGTSVVIRGQGELTIDATYTLKRNILKALTNEFAGADIYSTNISNTYKDKEKLLIASPSIPSYNAQALNTTDRSITFSGSFTGEEFKITTTTDHGFRTGDAIYYIPEKVQQTYTDPVTLESKVRTVVKSELFDEGLYFVKRIEGSTTTIKLAKSRTNIYNGIFVTVGSSNTIVNDNIIKPYEFRDKTLESQRILREINPPINDGDVVKTEPGYTGILVNGVEILNYKSNDIVRFGQIDEIEVVDEGSDYDLINPPLLNISDSVGTGATGYVGLTGSLKEIRVLDPGFDYEETPTIKISGGNGEGATALVNMKLKVHESRFSAEGVSTSVSLTSNTIGFTTYHKFKNAEKVIYITDKLQGVGGITTDAVYHVHKIDDYTVKLHRNEGDAIAGINTVDLTAYGFGQQALQSYDKKSVLESVNITASGNGYQNKHLTVNSTGVSTSKNSINIARHGYSNGEIVTYESTSTEIGGLSSSNQYKVIVVDNNNFKLANAGVGGTNTTDYNHGVYVDLTSGGSGTHSFKYQPITVTLTGKVGIASIGTETFEATLQPLFRGGATSVHLENNGVGYGSSEIVNFDRQPEVTLRASADAQLQPIVVGGQISEVLVLNSGKAYTAPPDIVITGDGTGAVVTPVLSDGVITAVNVIEGGIGYTTQETSMSVLYSGSGVKFNSLLQTWRINLVQKNFINFTDDDGFIARGLNPDFGLQYTHLYAPRKLREAMYARNADGDVLYGKSDLRRVSSVEVASEDHSPIIGWAYDGNPIYGPYGYISDAGGIISAMKSSYVLKLKDNRPPTTVFPEGFFVEDYSYTRVSDETYLDEKNGRFCFTPEFPKGTYAYFATINSITADSTGAFAQYRRPEFPYLIGDSYKSIPTEFNYKMLSNQESIDLKGTSWLRNTDPYNLIEGNLEYDYLPLPDKLKQTVDIKAVSPGTIQSVGFSTGGDLYRVGDSIKLDETGTQGSGASIEVSRVLGKTVSSISVATSSITGLEVYQSAEKGTYNLFAATPHGFKDGDTISISGLSTTSSQIEGAYKIGVTTTTFSLTGIGTTSSGIGTVGVTGIVTYFNVAGDLSQLHTNDIIGIGTEQIKVLNIEPHFSRIRAQRGYNDNEIGIGWAHTVTSVLTVEPRILSVSAGFNTTSSPPAEENKELYWDPINTVAIGTESAVAGIVSGVWNSVGAGYTVPLSNPGTGLSEIFIPTRGLYIRGHGLETGDQITYNANVGAGISVMFNTETGTQIKQLPNDETLYVAKITDDVIGISTVKVGVGSTGSFVGIASTEQSSSTMFFTGIGTGVEHSFKTNFTPITAEVTRNLVTVATAATHGLKGSNEVWIDVNPSNTGINTFRYNDYNRRTLLNPQNFTAAGINTSTNIITIADHGLTTGEKVVHTATTPAAGLSDNGVYFIVRVDNNRFKLTNNLYNAKQLKPTIIGITSASPGTISPVNPPLTVYKNSTVTFDLSDSSLGYVNQSTTYAAFELNFYLDENFTEIWDKTGDSTSFEVTRTGVVGVTADAKVQLTVNDEIPQLLYYRLDPIYQSDLPVVKEEVFVDTEVVSGSRVNVTPSVYNGRQTIAVGATNTFTYSIADTPELASYTPAPSILSYETNSKDGYGGITKFEISSPGRNYYSLPGISSITSTDGRGAIVSIGSSNIGRVIKTKIDNIGYNFPTDTTVRPDVGLGVIANVSPFMSFESIGITSRGRGYASAPKLIVFDGKTKKLVDGIDLKYKLGDSHVTILKNVSGLSDTPPTILPTQNDNGVGISTVGFNTNTNDVTVTLNVGFSTANSFPFAVGDKILVEGVSVGIGSTGSGYNSKDYDYQLFTVNGLDANLGGIGGTIGYRLTESMLDGKVPGEYSTVNSSGRVIPEKYFPLFNSALKPNDFLEGETVKSGDAVGIVEDWNSKVGIIKISTADELKIGDRITGESSDTQGEVASVLTFPSTLEMGPVSRVENGWETASGFINDNLQRVQDSFYYQNFSYSLKSKVTYDTWDDVVSTNNHTAGFRKFSDYQLESAGVSMKVGLTTTSTNVEAIGDLVGQGSLHCVNDFDLVTENSRDAGAISDEVVFNSRILQDYYESVGNRVLSIDDFSGSFNSHPRATPFSVALSFPLNTNQAMKFITYVRDRRYVGQRQIMIVDLVHDNSFGYINQYGQAGTVYPLGSFDFNIVGTDGRLLWYPNNYKVNDYDVVAISYRLDDAILGIGTTSLGCAEIFTSSTEIASGAKENVVSIGYTYRSLKVLASISGSTHNEWEMEELNIIHDGTNVDVMEYGQLTTNMGAYVSASGFGTYVPYISGSDIKVDFQAHTGIACTVNTIVVGLSTAAYVGIDTYQLKHVNLESRTTAIAASGTPGIHTVGEYLTLMGEDDHFDAAYFIAQVEDTTGNTYSMEEIVLVDDYNTDLGTTESYIVSYGNVETNSGLGTFGAQVKDVGGAKWTQLMFTPNPSIATQVKVFMNAFQIEDDSNDSIEFTNGRIETLYNLYEGTEKSIKRSFNLTHRNNEIFNKSFDGSDTQIVSTTNNTITLPNHFFVSGEEVKYVHQGAGTTSAIGIENTTFAGVGATDKLPGTVFIYKVNEDSVKLASSAENALKLIPETIGITTVGVGTSTRFASINQNSKCLLALDNIIQSPVVATSVTTGLAKTCYTTDDLLTFTGITSFIGGDLIKVEDEIMRIDGVGIGSTNVIRVRRAWLGTALQNYVPATQVTKVNGNYNIVENTLTFAEAPYGNIPIGTSTNPPDDRDWTGISTSSSFQGRTFMRSGIVDSSNESYYKNKVFDDISSEFTGDRRNFNLESSDANVTGIATENAVVLVNDVFQSPTTNYTLNENAGITSIRFTGTATSITSDVNTSNLPIGGVILSVGSTEGFGYQPLVAAGGTAVVSTAGTFSAITLSNTGQGYRSGIGQVVNVGIQTQAWNKTNITNIGTATIGSAGALTGVAVTSTFVSYKPRDIINVGYSRSTGISTITTYNDHGLTVGDEIALSGIALTCDYAPAVGIYTAIYDETSGIMTVTTTVGHGLTSIGTQKSNVILTGMAFTCSLDNGAQNHIYPRNRDRFYDTSVPVVSMGNTLTASNAWYDPVVGIVTVMTSTTHGMTAGDRVNIADNSLTFTCEKDNHESYHSYPRPTDYASNKWLKVLTIPNAQQFSVKIVQYPPSTNTGVHTFVSATASGITTQTGDITVNVGYSAVKDQFPHTFVGTAGTGPIKAGGAYGHHFVGAKPDALVSGGNYLHSFSSAVTGGVTITGVGTTTPTNATYDPETGDLVMTISNHGGVVGGTVGIATGGISFTCSMDGYDSVHAYPRQSDPIGETTTAITAVTGDTVTINVGVSTLVKFTPSAATYDGNTGNMVLTVADHGLRGSTAHTVVHADYNPVTGIMTCMVPNHSFTNGDRVKFADNSLTFTCAKDSHATNHTYPRDFDWSANRWLAITGVTTSVFEVQVLDTVPSTNTGVHTFVSATASGMTLAGASVRLAKEGFTFTCGMDGHGTEHAYPRTTDPMYNTAVSIGTTTANTLTVNVGRTPVVGYGASSAVYYQATGDLKLGIGTHDVVTGDNIKIDRESLIFTCTKDGNSTQHRYPREGDPSYDGVPVSAVGVGTTIFEVNIGVSTVKNYYTGVTTATVQPVIIAPRPTDEAAPGATVLTVINNKSFEVQTGISSRIHFYARGGQVEKPMDVVIDDPLSYSNIPLQYSSSSSGIGSAGTIDIVVGQASSITDFRINNTGFAYQVGETLTVPYGGGSGIPTTSDFGSNEFQLSVDRTFNDEFNAWTIGTLELLDDVSHLFDSGRITFPLTKDGTIVSIRAAKGSVINVQDVLLIFVNDILQVPGEGYKFDGGSIIEFTEAPKAGDTCKIIFYKGSGDDVDVVFRAIIETVKIGDDLQIFNKDDQGSFWKEDPRIVTQVTSTDTVDTNPYYGPGNTTIADMLRPVRWCRQTEDKIINDLPVGKDRELYEPVINPTSSLVASVGIGSTEVYVQSVRPFFNPQNESSTAANLSFQDKIKFTQPSGTKVSAAATAVVSGLGTISSFTLSTGGVGYGATPDVSIGKTSVGVGTTADAIGTVTISGGVVTGIAVSVGGAGYSQTSPPQVLVGPPGTSEEESKVGGFSGDFGSIVGFGTTTVSTNPHFMFDFFINRDSFLRDPLVMVDAAAAGSITTVSSMTAGDYFVIDNSNIGLAATSITTLDGSANVVGIGTSFIDNVYRVASAETVRVNVTGIGYTDVRRVFTRVADTMNNFTFGVGITSSPNYGNFSWGKIDITSRGSSTAYTAHTSSGVGGLSTSPSVERSASLKYKGYNV